MAMYVCCAKSDEGNVNGAFTILKCNFKVKVCRHCRLYEEVAPYELPQLL